MDCPLYVDYTRECIGKIEVYPEKLSKEILDFCETSKHERCPFYRLLVIKIDACNHIKKCPIYAKFQNDGFYEFSEMSNKYCTSKNHKKCKRYILNKEGKEVPIWLHPSGEKIE